MMNPLVSVIIPAFNAEKYLESTIRSVLKQTYSPIELIVVDDGSRDSTKDIVKTIQKDNEGVELIEQENQGVSAARNEGFKNSRGVYVAFLDADDIWLENNISEKVDFLREGKEIGLVHSDTAVIDDNGNLTGELLQGKEGNILNDLLVWNGTCIPAPSSILVERKLIEEIGFFDTNLSTSADKDFFFRAAKVTLVGRVPLVTWYYRKHGSNMHLNIGVMEKDERYVYRKARKLGLFESKKFERKCLAKMHLVMAGSWRGDGANNFKALLHGIKALILYPAYFSYILRRL